MKKTSVSYTLFIPILSIVLCLVFFGHVFADMTFPVPPEMLPLAKKDMRSGSQLKVGSSSELLVPASFSARYGALVDSVGKTLSSLPSGGVKVSIKTSLWSGAAGGGEVAPDRPESYLVEVGKDSITVTGHDDQGILNGLTTLEVLLTRGKGTLTTGKILDWPDLKIRGLYVMQRDIAPETVLRLITTARYGHFNVLVLSLGDGIRIPSMAQMLGGRPWTKEELLKVANFAKENGMAVVPELRLLTHQERFLKVGYPRLMFNHSTYNPDNPETYKIVFKVIDEIIDILKPKAMHIGHDESAGYKDDAKPLPTRLLKDEKMLPPELFLKDVEILSDHLRKRGVETWMWGDMLISPDEFPQMWAKQLHGRRGYSLIRGRIPKDVVVCDWHFNDRQEDFPSAKALADQGNRVIGTTFIKTDTIRKFSRYVARMPKGGEGMLATLWGMIRRGKTDIVERTLKVSASSFWNAR